MMMVKKDKPILHDPQIIPRVQQYLEENVDKTYVDVAVMARELQMRYPEYSRRKSVPFRLLVEQAYKTVLHSYGLDSNPSSEGEGDDDDDLQEVGAPNRGNQLGDTLNNFFSAKPRSAGATGNNDDAPIDISSDDSDDGEDEGPPQTSTTITRIVTPVAPTENGTAKPVQVNKKRRYDEISSGTEKIQAATVPPVSSKPKKYKKEVVAKKATVTFADVGGMDKTLKQLCELLLHIKHPEIYNHIGLPPPRGFLLHGPPGSGKTLLAHAIAGQLNIPLLEVPATELVAGVSGESEERIRDVFEQAAALSPCVLFLDEIDAISSNRNNAQKDMERRIVAQLLNSLDGLSQRPNGNQVLVIGATNRPDTLDPALRRVGRFDQEILLGIPDRDARREILKIICRSLKLDDFDFEELAALSPGYVGADLLALATRAASTAVKRIFKLKEGDMFDAADESVIEIREESPLVVAEKAKEAKEVVMEVDEILDSINKPAEAATVVNGEAAAVVVAVAVTTPQTAQEAAVDEEVRAAESVANLVAELAEEVAKAKPAHERMDTDDQAVDVLMEDKSAEKTEELAAAVAVVEETPPVEVKKVDEEPAPVVVEAPKEVEAVAAEEPPKAEPKKTSSVPRILNLNDMLSWLSSTTPPLSPDELSKFKITFADFREALKLVQPSAKREGFITVPDVTWDDIGSLSNIREELKMAILAPVKFPDRLKLLGLSAPSGVLLCGPPGCGKTLLAKAVANEAGINFISVKGPELLNMYVGESERAVRQCFQRARNSAPCVIFFDEFDSLCPKRSESSENSAGMRVVNQLLTEMDGIEDRRGVYLMAATNRPDIVDPAVLRPGRFDKILYVGLPTPCDRVDILRAVTKHGTKPPLADDVDLDEIAAQTDNFTGADLAGLVRQAALISLKDSILQEDVSAGLKVHASHMLNALKDIRPSVSPEDQAHYDLLRQKYSRQP